MQLNWGVLGPDVVTSTRRVRTLGLGSVVRDFNDLAVPGMGGVWFIKQLVLALLGIDLASEARMRGNKLSNIQVANAVEALGCWSAMQNSVAIDPRVRGRRKLHGRDDVSFRSLLRPSAYVTQPMRMATGQCLLALGLVDSSKERFNAYECTDDGLRLLEVAFEGAFPNRRSVRDNMLRWIAGDATCVKTAVSRAAMASNGPVNKAAREIVKERLIASDASGRRKGLLAWLDTMKPQSGRSFAVSWGAKPETIDEGHWRDLRIGSEFFTTRDNAIAVLNRIEGLLGVLSDRSVDVNHMPREVEVAIQALQRSADRFLSSNYDPSPDGHATGFCESCSSAATGAMVILSLVERDDRVLRLRGTQIVPGPAFVGRVAAASAVESDDVMPEEEVEVSGGRIEWPDGISFRLPNLVLLNADLQGNLDQLVAPTGN